MQWTIYVKKNLDQKKGYKFAALGFGHTPSFIAEKIENINRRHHISLSISKKDTRYRKDEIKSLFPHQNIHTSHMYSVEINDWDDFQIILDNNFLQDSKEFVQKNGLHDHRKEHQRDQKKIYLKKAAINDYKSNISDGNEYS